MAGGPGKIDEYNQTLTPEQRKESARKAAQASRPNLRLNSNIRRIAKMINKAPARPDLQIELAKFGFQDADFSNAAGIALAVYHAAINGDMKAVEKWEKYVGQYVKDTEEKTDGGVRIIDDL